MTNTHPSIFHRRLPYLFAALVVGAGVVVGTGQTSELSDAAGDSATWASSAMWSRMADGNDDRQITVAEAGAFGRAYFADLDADGDGDVRLHEYVAAKSHDVWQAWLANVSAEVRARILHRGFARHDANRDGAIDPKEFAARVSIDHGAADLDRDGTVSIREFHQRGLVL